MRRHLISIATYRRPEGLSRLLDSLLDAIDDSVDIVITDNDARESAREVATNHQLSPTYVVEPVPGIASARNCGLSYFNDAYETIIFLDDDEWVSSSWFSAFQEMLERDTAGVIQGPVNTILPNSTPRWITRGGFYQRKKRATGDTLVSAATNNTVLRYSAWKMASFPRFDTDFSTTGGSDWDFFWGIRKSGSKIKYCAEAEVSEDVPDSRLSRRWINQRYVRNGIVEARVARKHGEPLARFIFVAIATSAVGVSQIAADLVRGRGIQSQSLSRVLIPYGKLTGLFGKRIDEYARSE